MISRIDMGGKGHIVFYGIYALCLLRRVAKVACTLRSRSCSLAALGLNGLAAREVDRWLGLSIELDS